MGEKKATKGHTNSAADYPVIYSYIYEREREDIKRLAGKFRSAKKTPSKSTSSKAIIGFKVEDGKAIPIYSDKPLIGPGKVAIRPASDAIVLKSGVVRQRAVKTPKKRKSAAKSTKGNNQKEEG